MSSSERKKKRKLSPVTLQSLPGDLLLNCFARISRLYYPTLSLVCKSFRSLLASSELYKTRSLLNRTESCLYVCLRFSRDHSPRWFTLCMKPNQTLETKSKKRKKKKKEEEKKSSGYVLVPMPIHHSPPPPDADRSAIVAVGSNIYNIGGSMDNGLPSSSLWILDCRSHTWHAEPNMCVESNHSCASVVNGKIYIAHMGGDSDFLVKVFDTKTRIWDHVPIPEWKIKWNWHNTLKTACVDGKFHMMNGRQGLAYSPKEGMWDIVEPEMDSKWNWSTYCDIENILYRYYHGEFKWYDTKERSWKNLKGLEGRLAIYPIYGCVKLADYGGKMVVLWDMGSPKIHCAVVTLEKQKNREISGEVEWLDDVLTVSGSYEFVKVLATTL